MFLNWRKQVFGGNLLLQKFHSNFGVMCGGRWFAEILHNIQRWSTEILIFPYKGRYMVKKGPNHPYVINEWPLKYIIVRTLKNDLGDWPSFSPSEARLKNPNAERRRSRSLAF